MWLITSLCPKARHAWRGCSSTPAASVCGAPPVPAATAAAPVGKGRGGSRAVDLTITRLPWWALPSAQLQCLLPERGWAGGQFVLARSLPLPLADVACSPAGQL